jgi:hypothetical protein
VTTTATTPPITLTTPPSAPPSDPGSTIAGPVSHAKGPDDPGKGQGTGKLAFTGVEDVVPMGIGALLLLTLGTGFMWAGRKRDAE